MVTISADDFERRSAERSGVTVRVDIPLSAERCVLMAITCHPAHVIRLKAAHAADWHLESESSLDVGQVLLMFRKVA